MPAGKKTGGEPVPSRRVIDPVLRAQQQATRFYADIELTRKSNQMQIDAIRRTGRHSENLLLRAMQLDKPIFAGSSSSTLKNTSATRHISDRPEPVKEDYVNGGAGVLLSRGAVPTSVPGRYSFTGFPTPSDWSVAAARQKELKVALQELEKEMEANEASVLSQTHAISSQDSLSATKFTHSDVANPIRELVQVIKPGSSVMGSSFRWQGTQAKSLKEEQFSWPSDYEHKFGSWSVGATKYGMLSHECDVPGGSVFVNKEAKRRNKKR